MTQELKAKLEEWASQGLISEDSRKEILRYEGRQVDVPPEEGSRSGEVLSYIGGLIILSGMYALLGDLWEQMSIHMRQAVLTVLTLVLFGVGHRLLKERARVVQRLGGFLSTIAVLGLLATVYYGLADVLRISEDVSWVVSFLTITVVSFLVSRRLLRIQEPFVQASGVLLQYTTAVSGGLGLFVFLAIVVELSDELSLLTTSGICTVVSVYAWVANPTSTTHTISYLYVLFGLLSGVNWYWADASTFEYGLILWATAVLWLLGCLTDRLRPAATGILISSLLLPMSSSVVLAEEDLIGSTLLLISGIVLITYSTFQFQMRVFTVGALSVLVASPTLMYQLFEDLLPTSVLLILSGTVLLGGGLLLNRIRRTLAGIR